MQKVKFYKRKSVYIPAIIAVVLIGLIIYRSNSKKNPVALATVTRATVTQEVSVTGTVKSKESVELAFEKTGKIKAVNVSVGDKVPAGTVLISLENGVETSALEDAQAKLASAQAHYADLAAGGSPAAVQVKQTELDKADADLATDYAAVANIVIDSFNKADDAVHRQADTLFSNPLSSNPQLSFASSDQQSVIDSESGRFAVETVLAQFKIISQSDMSAAPVAEKTLNDIKNYLSEINDFLVTTNRALNAALNLSDTTAASDKDALNTARTNINTAITSVTNQIQAIATQKIVVQTAKDNLALTKAPATPDVLAGALADVQSADANVKNAQAVLAQTYIVAPFTGVITRQDAKIGEIATAGTVLTALATDNFKVEAYIPEADIAKVAINNPAQITLDAYGNDTVFNAHVVAIDPAETVIDGVSTYKTTLLFDTPDPRIRSGMTANTTIITATHDNALTIPARAVYDKNGQKFVKATADGKNFTDREVTVGIRGANGEVEILSGLSQGDQVAASAQTQ
ncbi:efflux RND transporter periplasmic adaptor subunit [Patescibacteria group bacterium]|nr:efflux RND transporter periplasmic adaptor subunit [Patescibacteria group bacterium]